MSKPPPGPAEHGGGGLFRITIFYLLYINTGELSLLHVPSTFATVNTHANVFFVFLSGGISKEWRHIVDFEGETLPIVPRFTGISGNMGDRKNSSRES